MGPLLVATGLLSCAATNPLGRQGEGQEAHQAMNQVRRSQSRERSHSHHRQNRGNHLRRSGRSDDVRQSLVIWSSLCPTDTIHRRFRVGRGFEKEQWYSRGSSNLQGGRGGPTSAADGESLSGIPGPMTTTPPYRMTTTPPGLIFVFLMASSLATSDFTSQSRWYDETTTYRR